MGEVQIWICLGVNGYKENEAPFKKRGMSGLSVYRSVIQAVGTLVILYSSLASRMSHRPKQPVSDLTTHLQNTSIPKAEIGETE